MKSIVVLISGRGSNMRAIVEACAAEGWPARIAAVIGNRREAEGLAWARGRGIETAVVEHAPSLDRDAFDAELARTIDRFAPDVVALAGFMRVLGAAFVRRYEGRLLNVHPSLLPAFAGLQTHRRALAAGCKLSGATVHFVTAEVDNGPIVIQARCRCCRTTRRSRLPRACCKSSTASIRARLRWLIEGRLRIEAGIVSERDGQAQVVFD